MNYLHGGSAGDVLYSIPTVLSMSEQSASLANFYLQLNAPANYYEGAVHPAGNVLLNQAMIDFLTPLLKSQRHFGVVKVHEDESIDVDLNLFRRTGFPPQAGHLAMWYQYAFAAWYDLTKPWIEVDPMPGIEDRLLVNRTSRYRNQNISYAFLKEYRPLFVGLKEEFLEFRKEVQCDWLVRLDGLELARAIAGARAFVGNQSLAYAIADAMKIPRCLEVSLRAPNVLPFGGEARGAINQAGFEWNVRAMMEGQPGVTRPPNLPCPACRTESPYQTAPKCGWTCENCGTVIGMRYNA